MISNAPVIQSESESNPNLNPNPNPTRESAFDRFWNAYPKKKNKGDAEKAFKKVKVPIETLLEAIEKQKKTEQWKKENGQFIPYPATWLNAQAWEDEVEVKTADRGAVVTTDLEALLGG